MTPPAYSSVMRSASPPLLSSGQERSIGLGKTVKATDLPTKGSLTTCSQPAQGLISADTSGARGGAERKGLAAGRARRRADRSVTADARVTGGRSGGGGDARWKGGS